MANRLAQLASEYGASRQDQPRNMLERMAQDIAIRKSVQDMNLPSAYRSQEEGLQAPNVLGGLVSLDPTDYVGSGELMEGASAAKGLLAAKAAAVPALTGIFAGQGAKTSDLAMLQKAKDLQAAGVPDRDIHAQTGWFFGAADGKPRFEIPDNKAQFNLRNAPIDAYGAQELAAFDALHHPELRKAYPVLEETKFLHYPTEEYRGASFDPTDNVVTFGREAMRDGSGISLHELQHAIQDHEGFAHGGSVGAIAHNPMQYAKPEELEYAKTLPAYRDAPDKEEFLKRYAQYVLKDPYDAYHRLAGEAESRLTEARLNMTPQQRAASYPPDMYDVPVDHQIVRMR